MNRGVIFFRKGGCVDRERKKKREKKQKPDFYRSGRIAAKHKNVDNVNERNWRFLFSSWRSSSCALFYAPPSSSFDSIVRRNADWILDFTYEPLAAPLACTGPFLFVALSTCTSVIVGFKNRGAI